MGLPRRACLPFAAVALIAACGRKPDTTSTSAASASAPIPATAQPAAQADAAPVAPRVSGSFGISCGQPNDAPIAEGSLRLPTPWLFERPDFDAIVHDGTVSYVTEAWKADLQKGCEHQYQVHLRGSGPRARFQEIAKKVGVTPTVNGGRFRLQVDAPTAGLPFFVMVEPVGADNVVINILHPSADFRTCLRAAVEALPASLRITNGLQEAGAQPHYVSIVREEGRQPWCHADFEWFEDTKIFPKVRSWIDQRHKVGKERRFDWDDGGEGSMTEWSATFRTSRKNVAP